MPRHPRRSLHRDGAWYHVLSCGRYIERNPLAAGPVAVPWVYRWSSCRVYALGEHDALVSRNPYYGELAATAERRREPWREFLPGEDVREAAIRGGDWTVGGEGLRRMRTSGGRPAPRAGRPLGLRQAQRTLFPELLERRAAK